MVSGTLAFFIDKLLDIGKPAPACSDEACVVDWVIDQTQQMQMLYDSAIDAHTNGTLTDEELKKVEELYKHAGSEIKAGGLSGLGVLEV